MLGKLVFVAIDRNGGKRPSPTIMKSQSNYGNVTFIKSEALDFKKHLRVMYQFLYEICRALESSLLWHGHQQRGIHNILLLTSLTFDKEPSLKPMILVLISFEKGAT